MSTLRRVSLVGAAATIAAVLLAGPPALRRVCRDRDPWGTAYAEYSLSRHDPWGQPFVTRSIVVGTELSEGGLCEEYRVEHPWSPGPDGVDDGGKGDDFVIYWRCLTGVDQRWEHAYKHAHRVCIALAISLAWAFTAAWHLAAPRSSTRREVARSLLIAAALGPWCVALGMVLGPKLSLSDRGLVVPRGLAIAGTTWLAGWLAALALRLHRARGESAA